MSDDLVKQSLLELQDLVRCRCHPAYTSRGLRDPDCECDSAEAVKVVADRIKELEVKLKKAVGALGDIGNGEPEWPEEPQKELDWCRNRANETLAELEGHGDE